MCDHQGISVNDLGQTASNPSADDSPESEDADADPLKASLALAVQTTTEWLISPLAARSSRDNWHA